MRKLDEFLSKLGEARLRKMIESNISFASVMPPGAQREALKYRSVLKILEGVPVRELLPSWAVSIVDKYGAKGQQWMQAQEAWLRQMLGG